MPAPTALQPRPWQLVQDVTGRTQSVEDDSLASTNPFAGVPSTTPLLSPADFESSKDSPKGSDADVAIIDTGGRPFFPPCTETSQAIRVQTRKVPIPPHRMTPLKSQWSKIYGPIVENLKLQVRMNPKSRAVELRTSRHHTTRHDALQNAEDFLKAFAVGFDVDDAVALLRLDDLFVETFEIKDVKTLQGQHMGRAIGRIAGKDGKTKFAIENTSRTRVVLADSKVHILGGYSNIKIAREAIVSLILGKPPGKVYSNLRSVTGRMKERF